MSYGLVNSHLIYFQLLLQVSTDLVMRTNGHLSAFLSQYSGIVTVYVTLVIYCRSFVPMLH